MAWNDVLKEVQKIPANTWEAGKAVLGTAGGAGSGVLGLVKGIAKAANSVLAFVVGLGPRLINFTLSVVKARPIMTIVAATVAGVAMIASSNKKHLVRAQEVEAADLQERIANTRAERMKNFTGPETPQETRFQNMVKPGQQQGITQPKATGASPQPMP